MSTLITWNPFGELDELQNRLGGLFFNGFPNRMGFPNPMGNGDALTLADGSPLVDITQDDQEYLFKADLPEMKRWSEIDAEILSFLARSGSTSISISECVSNVEIFESKARYRRVGFQFASSSGFSAPSIRWDRQASVLENFLVMFVAILLLTSHRLQFSLPRVYSLRFLFSYTSWARTNR